MNRLIILNLGVQVRVQIRISRVFWLNIWLNFSRAGATLTTKKRSSNVFTAAAHFHLLESVAAGQTRAGEGSAISTDRAIIIAAVLRLADSAVSPSVVMAIIGAEIVRNLGFTTESRAPALSGGMVKEEGGVAKKSGEKAEDGSEKSSEEADLSLEDAGSQRDSVAVTRTMKNWKLEPSESQFAIIDNWSSHSHAEKQQADFHLFKLVL